ncbi:MAG: DUF3577 domain-containing protein [Pseudomonadota bacterium]
MANRTSNASSPRANEEVTFFDLITSGIGYLNRIREVQPNDGDPYTCCKINALVGPSNKVAYREIDLRVVGTQALEALDIIDQAIPNKDAKVIVCFRMGDAKPDSYVIQADDGRGNQRPKTRFCIKGRLLKITSCKIDGQVIDLPGLDDEQTDQDHSGHDGHPDGQDFGDDTDQQQSQPQQQARSSSSRQRSEPEQQPQQSSQQARRAAPASRNASTSRRPARAAA